MMRTVRPIRVEGDVAFVPLTRGYEAIIDAEDVPLVQWFNWSALPNKRSVYAFRSEWVGGRKTTIRMHRVIAGPADGKEVDHIDGNGLNNRKSNLRQATASENRRNQRLSKANSSGLKGVSWNKRESVWEAYIRVDGKKKSLGSFSNVDEAHAAYCRAAERFHGEFARNS